MVSRLKGSSEVEGVGEGELGEEGRGIAIILNVGSTICHAVSSASGAPDVLPAGRRMKGCAWITAIAVLDIYIVLL
jgi:hypothetical protein